MDADRPQGSQQTLMNVRSCLEEQHGTQVCRPNDFLKIFGILVLIGGAAVVINTQGDNLVTFAEMIMSLHGLGHVIFYVLFIWVGLPWGYSWSTLMALVGFAYGW